MKGNTGLMLYQIRGPLNNLLDNLSGENGNYWLEALKKMLRKEETQKKLPAEILAITEALNSRENANIEIEEWVKYLNFIPSVCEANSSEDEDLIDINVYPNLASFLHEDKDADTALFVLETNGCVRRTAKSGERTDDVFDKWCKNSYENISSFYRALIELCKMYKDAVPKYVE